MSRRLNRLGTRGLEPYFDRPLPLATAAKRVADEASLSGDQVQSPQIGPTPAASFSLLDAIVVFATVVGTDFIRPFFPPTSIGSLGRQLITAFLVVTYLATRSRLSRRVLFGQKATRGLVLLGIGAGLAIWAAIASTTLGLRLILGWNDPVYPIWTVVRPIAEISLWAIISTAIVAPLLEEIVFRSVMFRGIATRVLPWVATIIVSLLFAWLHVAGGFTLVDALWAFVLSVVAIQLLRKTGSLWPAIAVHGTLNTTSIIVGLVLFQLIGWGQVIS